MSYYDPTAFWPYSVTSNGPIAHWTFDEGYGNTAHDLSGNANHGTLVNSPTWVPGIFGGAIELSGTSSNNVYVNVPQVSSLEPNGHVSVSLWYTRNVESASNFQGIVGTCCGTSQYHMLLETNGNAKFEVVDSSGVRYIADSGFPLSINTWHHLVGLYTGSHVKIYVDGICFANVTTPSINLVNGFNGSLGETNGATVTHALDELRIYGRAITDGGPSIGDQAGGEVRELWNRRFEAYAIPQIY